MKFFTYCGPGSDLTVNVIAHEGTQQMLKEYAEYVKGAWGRKLENI